MIDRLPRLVFPAAAFLLLLGAVSCSDGPTDPAWQPPAVVSTRVASGASPIFRSVDVALASAAPVEVEYWSADTPRLRVRDTLPTALHTVFLPRLRSLRHYNYEISARGGDGERVVLQSGAFDTDSLPAYLRDLRFDAAGSPTRPLIMMPVNLLPDGSMHVFVAVDAEGEIVWYYPAEPGVEPSGYVRRSNGNHVLMNQYRNILEVTPDGRVVASLTTVPGGAFSPHHEVIETPQKTLLFFSWENQTFGDTTVIGEAIWEWSPEQNTVVRRWRSSDMLSWPQDRGAPTTVSSAWLHSNAMSIGDHGNIIVSNRNTNQILSLSPDFKTLEWRLGGTGGQFAIAPEDQFFGQHMVREVSPGHLLMFDNGFENPRGYSRALELAYDVNTRTAHKVWEFRPKRTNYAPILGTAVRYPNGNTLVGFGTYAGLLGATGPAEAYEVSPTGAVVWHMEVLNGAPYHVYRFNPITDIGGEQEVSSP